ncbi:MAG: hypothetical protein ACO1N9_12350 [Flavobacterium sp.]
MIITAKYLVPKGYAAITLFPFIILHNEKQRQNVTLITHEKIHLRQQAELLIVLFYVWYGLEYLIRLAQLGSHSLAYRNISFEREAYFYESVNNYLNNRPFFAFLKFL